MNREDLEKIARSFGVFTADCIFYFVMMLVCIFFAATAVLGAWAVQWLTHTLPWPS